MSDADDVIHISPWLVKIAVTAILTGIGTIGLYMVLWAINDRGWKQEVISRLNDLDRSITEVKKQTDIVPVNTQKIQDLRERVIRLEDDQYSNSKGDRP